MTTTQSTVSHQQDLLHTEIIDSNNDIDDKLNELISKITHEINDKKDQLMLLKSIVSQQDLSHNHISNNTCKLNKLIYKMTDEIIDKQNQQLMLLQSIVDKIENQNFDIETYVKFTDFGDIKEYMSTVNVDNINVVKTYLMHIQNDTNMEDKAIVKHIHALYIMTGQLTNNNEIFNSYNDETFYYACLYSKPRVITLMLELFDELYDQFDYGINYEVNQNTTNAIMTLFENKNTTSELIEFVLNYCESFDLSLDVYNNDGQHMSELICKYSTIENIKLLLTIYNKNNVIIPSENNQNNKLPCFVEFIKRSTNDIKAKIFALYFEKDIINLCITFKDTNPTIDISNYCNQTLFCQIIDICIENKLKIN